MKNLVVRDFTFIFLIFAVYFGVSLIVANLAGDMTEAWAQPSLVALAVPLLCAIVWYAIGEWIMRPSTSKASWYTLWILFLLVILGTAIAILILDPEPDLTLVYFIGGAGAYYLATMLFSPFHGKFLIWPSTHIRIGW